MKLLAGFSRWLGARLSGYPNRPSHACNAAAPTQPAELMSCVQPGDVLLVEGMTRVSTAIKYLTQSTWSHAALYVGVAVGTTDASGEARCFVEADIEEGIRAVGVSTYRGPG